LLEARGARAVLKDDVTLLVGRVRARLDPLSLALGRLGLADLRLDDVIVMFPPHPDDHPERDRLTRILRPIEVSGEFLRKHPCDIPDLTVRGLTLLVTRRHMLEVLLEAASACRRARASGAIARARSSSRARQRRHLPGFLRARRDPRVRGRRRGARERSAAPLLGAVEP
jgi:hypothetical protein